jgi:cysteinyl-tRNA synthetase
VYTLVLKNTKTGKKEPFTLHGNDNTVKMYVCGITPYDYAHVGHGRCYVVFDVLYRLLQSLRYDVVYVRNFTDIDDKLIDRAVRDYDDVSQYAALAQFFIDAYHQDMSYLNCLAPTYEPRVTESIPQIIEFVQGLIDTGHAYEVNGNVYFRIDSFDAYGELSKRNMQDDITGYRVEVNQEKHNPHDFALWKKEDGDMFFDSPWGHGRPGWHIECSVMAKRYLGETIDIHCGGLDLLFPHHENERAQSEALHNKPFVRYWVHNAFVQINKEKMSKSLGNFFTLRDLFEESDPMIIRYFILSHHYRSPIDFHHEGLKSAGKAYKRLCKIFADVDKLVHINQQSPVVQQMISHLCDDLNTQGAIGVLFEHLKTIQEDEHERAAVKTIMTDILGLTLSPIQEPEVEIPYEVQELIQQREQARKDRDWGQADALRDRIREMGYEPEDKKSGDI